MVSSIQPRFRIFYLFVILGLVLCAFIPFTSGLLRQRKLATGRPYDYGHDSSYFYGGDTESDDRWAKSPPTSAPPTYEDDYQIANRRGAFDHKGRSLIFKSLILAPLTLVVIILLIVAVVPIPYLSSPLHRRSLQSATASSPLAMSSMYTLKIVRDVLTSEECIERISCELSKISRSYDSTSWIPSTLEKLLIKSKWSERIVQGLTGTSPSACSQFTCTPAKRLLHELKMAFSVD